jgi:hypothetical protein
VRHHGNVLVRGDTGRRPARTRWPGAACSSGGWTTTWRTRFWRARLWSSRWTRFRPPAGPGFGSPAGPGFGSPAGRGFGPPAGRGDGGFGGPGGVGFQPPRFALLEALDADSDGKLSSKEIENAVQTLKKLDKDKDGKLDREEIGWPPVDQTANHRGRRAGFGGFGGPGGPGAGPPGQFGPGGFGGGPNGPPGQRAPGGFGGPPGFGGRPSPGRGSGAGAAGDIVDRIMSNDKDDDGKVSQQELPENMQRLLRRADSNGDGAIDKSEAEAIRAQFGRGGRGGPARSERPPRRPQNGDGQE